MGGKAPVDIASMDRQKRLFLISDNTEFNAELKSFLEDYGIEAYVYEKAFDLAGEISEQKPQVIVTSSSVAAAPPLEVVKQVKQIESHLPVIVIVGPDEYGMSLEALKHGAYATVKVPGQALEEIYYILNNALLLYLERQEALQFTAEMKKRYEHDRLNLLELELVKNLQLMIGETEERSHVFKNSFTLIKYYLVFDIFAALTPRTDDIEIYMYPNVPFNQSVANMIPETLMEKMKSHVPKDLQVRVSLEGRVAEAEAAPETYNSLIVPLLTGNNQYGYAGIYRALPFDYHEESVFKRFCSHISLALEKISLFQEIKALSTNDGLTGLFNHLFIITKLEEEVDRSVRYGSNLAITMFDVDNFKQVNDNFGHPGGDAVLKKIAQIFRKGLRSIDSVGRYGGEEFLVVLPETDAEGARAISERLRERVSEEDFEYAGSKVKVTMSGGVAVYGEAKDSSSLIKLADDNMYEAKRKGKNRIYGGTRK